MNDEINILTIDLEDWFHILNHHETQHPENWRQFPSRVQAATIWLLDLFEEFKVRATFFVLGCVAENNAELLQEIVRRGHSIASHGTNHQLIFDQTQDEFERDLLKSKQLIFNASGVETTAYRAPGFSITAEQFWVFDILAQNGFSIDASIFPASRDHGGMESFPFASPCTIKTEKGNTIREFPINTQSIFGKSFVFSGGGYFRLMPFPLIRHFFGSHRYNMTYFHPRDFDAGQPMMPGLSVFRNFKNRVGLKSSGNKIRKLLEHFNFQDIYEAKKLIDWSSRPNVYIEQNGISEQ